jgi:hypothetical protein
MTALNRLLAVVVCAGLAACSPKAAHAQTKEQRSANGFRGAMLSVEQVTETQLLSLRSTGMRAVAVQLRGGAAELAAERKALERIRRAKLDLYYWIEVARCRELADAHPAWMASLQGHTEWRRLFKNPPAPRANEVVKTYPWVPILNEEPFQGQLARIREMLEDRPKPKGVFLNDLQGAPSACGCGNHLCRWTSDYGKIRTATPLGNDAPGAFVAAVQKLVPQSQVIPVWTTECEEHDGAKDGLCAGVGCFNGICWKAYTEQLMPVAKQSETLGVLLPYRAFQRDLQIYGEPAGWLTEAVRSFETMPVRYRGVAIPPSRLIAVIQGWNVTDEQVSQQMDVAQRAGVSGYLVSYTEIEQSWEPRIFQWK